MLDDEVVVPLDNIQVDESLNFEGPVATVERKMKIMRNEEIPLLKFQWQHRKGSKWTWELEAEMREHYPELFMMANFEDEV